MSNMGQAEQTHLQIGNFFIKSLWKSVYHFPSINTYVQQDQDLKYNIN